MIASVGEIMVESLRCVDALPGANQTLVIDGVDLRVGGPAYNVARQLTALGDRPALVSILGTATAPLVLDAIHRSAIDDRWLIASKTSADLLFSLQRADGYHSVFQRAALPDEAVEALRAPCLGATHLVLAGSRHAAIRRLYAELAADFSGKTVVFAPNYSIYLYERDQIATICRHADIIAVNEREAAHLSMLFALPDEAALLSLTAGLIIVTREARGASVFGAGDPLFIPSVSGSPLDVIGAGDAFLSAFLHARFGGAPVGDAGSWAAAAAAVFIDDAPSWPALDVAKVESRLRQSKSAPLPDGPALAPGAP